MESEVNNDMQITELRKIICNALEIDEIDEDLSSVTCENWDSLGHLKILVSIENALREEGSSLNLDLSEAVSYKELVKLLKSKSLISEVN